jgi:hypothetical protein
VLVRRMNTQILWNPERGRCDRCGRKSEHTRLFTSAESKTCFCKKCWEDYVAENRTEPGEWSKTVAASWKEDTALCLEFSEPASGRFQVWN